MKKALSFFLAVTLTMSLTIPIFAKNTNIISENAVYVNDEFYADSMLVDGGVYSANGNICFSDSNSNTVNGNLTLNSTKEVVFESKNKRPDIAGKTITLDNTKFDFETVDFPIMLEIDNEIEEYEAGYQPAPETVTTNTNFEKLTIKNYLKVDVSKNDIYISADEFIMTGNAKLELIGNNKLYLFVNDEFLITGSSVLNTGLDHNKVDLILNCDSKVNGDISINANVYNNSDELVAKNGEVHGNIYSNLESLELEGNLKVYGTLYAPNTECSIEKAMEIYGMVVAHSLELSGKSKVLYDKDYAIDVAPEPTPEPTAKPEPTSVPVPTAKPEPTTAPVPTVKPEPTSTPVPTTVPEPTKSPEAVNDIPDGTQIFINYPYAYLYGYDYGAVGGEDTIKREEACSLLYRLLKQDNQLYGFDVNCSSVFEDLVDTNWAKNALMYMNYIGVYNDKIVQPTQEITRGEVAKIITFALKIHPDDSKQIKLDDLDKTNEYYYYIKALVDNGIMEGYNGKIKPAAKLTRAEYVTILNRVLGRDKRYDISNIEPIYPDLQDKSYWAYEDLMRASFGFSDEKVDGVYPIDPNRKHEREDIDFD